VPSLFCPKLFFSISVHPYSSSPCQHHSPLARSSYFFSLFSLPAFQ
jgi:hypothetical protein